MTTAEIYLDWVNNFLTLEVMAENYGLSIDRMNELIEEGRKEHVDNWEHNLKSVESIIYPDGSKGDLNGNFMIIL